MRKFIIAAACLVAIPALAMESRTDETPAAARSADGSLRVAQACGWYAIFICSRNRGDAQRWANRYTGYVVNTSSARYPNFAPGWYCTVEGPMGHGAAVATAARWRRSGASPTAYAKNAC